MSTTPLTKRAKRKYINYPVLKQLADLNSVFKKKYLHSYTCSSMIEVIDGLTRTKYCKRPWCSICNPIKTAVRLNQYKEELLSIDNLILTTLTCPNVPYDALRITINHFRKVFKQFRDSYKKRTNTDLKGVYNFEITFNQKTSLFHPHIHIIHSFLETTEYNNHTGNDLTEYWLKNTPTANYKAQDARNCTDLIEGFKYSNKSVFYKQTENGRVYSVPAYYLDKMYINTAGIRFFQPFGIKAKKDEDEIFEDLQAMQASSPDGSYIWELYNWFTSHTIDINTGEIILYQAIDQVPGQDKQTTEIITALSDFIPSNSQKNIYEQLSTITT